MKRAGLKIFLVKLRYTVGEGTQGYSSPLDLSGSYLSFDDLKKKIFKAARFIIPYRFQCITYYTEKW